MKLYKVLKSKIDNLGLYAAKDIKKGTQIIEYKGKVITRREAEENPKYDNEKAIYLFNLNKRYDLDGDFKFNTARLINHSCDPNCEVTGSGLKVWVYSVKDIKKGTTDVISTKDDVQDLISSLYYLRKNFSEDYINEGDFFTINMFYDSKNRELALKYLGKEVIRTKYGRIECLKLMPATNRSRIFKGEGSITIWLTNDENKIPIRIQADLLVGSIKADLNNYSGIVSPFLIKQKS